MKNNRNLSDHQIQKLANASPLKAFLYGVEPTGKWTYELAQETEKTKDPKGHTANIIAGNIGGATGGLLGGVAIPAAFAAVQPEALSDLTGKQLTRSGAALESVKQQLRAVKDFKKSPGGMVMAGTLGAGALMNLLSADFQYRGGRKAVKDIKKDWKDKSLKERQRAATTGALYD